MARQFVVIFGVVAAAIAAFLLAISAAASTDARRTSPDTSPDGRPVVLTTFTVLADMASRVAGDHLQVESIVKPGAEIHGYEPTAQDLTAVSEADLVLENGMHLEAWFEKFILVTDAPHVVISAGVEPITIEGGEYAGVVNPHAWMSPANGRIYVDNIVAAFIHLDPANAADYRANAAVYKDELTDIESELRSALASIEPTNRVLVTCEGAFSYLTQSVGMDEGYLWPVNSERQSTPQQVAGVIDLVRERNVPAVFCESTVSDVAARAIAAETDARFAGVLYVDSLSAAGGPVPTYLELLRTDARTIIAGLCGEGAHVRD